jgi:hypothetical protein
MMFASIGAPNILGLPADLIEVLGFSRQPLKMTTRKTLEELFDERTFSDEVTLNHGDEATSSIWPNSLFYADLPTRFPNRFPEAATLGDLERSVWWWRYAKRGADSAAVFPSPSKTDPFLQKIQLDLFLEGMQESAYFYEFRARYEGRYEWEFGSCWPNCSGQEKRFLDCLQPPDFPRKTHYFQEDSHWVQFPKFNLQLGDDTLVNYFKELLAVARVNTWNPKPLKGKGARKRELSWLPIELLDRKRYLNLVFNDSERSTVSKANREYKETCEKLGLLP